MGLFKKQDDRKISYNEYMGFDNDHCRWCGTTIVNNGIGWACSERCCDKANQKENKIKSKLKAKGLTPTYKNWKKVDSWF